MYAPVPIRPTLLRKPNLERLRRLLATDPPATRWAATLPVCQAFDFLDARGEPRRRSCLAALVALDKAGLIGLPAPRPRAKPQAAPAPPVPVPPAPTVPARVDSLAGLAVTPAETRPDRRLFQALLAREHPLGPVRAAGCQMRYLITAGTGLLGGFLFAAATRRQRARDAWIGWSPEQCDAGRHLVIGMARFLIRPSLRCRHLASKAQGLCLRRVAADFQRVYGFAPVLAESYVGPEHSGASYRAAGWVQVGRTAGRARDGRPVPPKAVYLRPLHAHWRARLGVRVAPLQPWEGLASDAWAWQEFGAAPFGDARLVKRLVVSVELLAQVPTRTLYTVARGKEALVTGYYRFIEHPNAQAISAETILSTHRQRTRQRMQGQRTVLLVQDGTDLNLATHRACEGLGHIAKNKGAEGTLGLHMHSTLAVAGNGLPLGVARIAFEAPPPPPPKEKGKAKGKGKKKEKANKKGKADKPATAGSEPPSAHPPKTRRWVDALRDSAVLAEGLEGVRTVAVMDSEGDAFEVFDARRRLAGRVDLLVRATHNRSLGPKRLKLFDRLRAQPAKTTLAVEVQRLSARRAARGQKESPGRAARTATCELRWKTLPLPVPAKKRRQLGTRPLHLTAVHVAEGARPADGSDPLEWLLLTTLPVTGPEQALEVVDLYRLRWRIEDWHRILKSGCRAERVAHQQAARVEREVAARAVIAWRLHVLALLGRDTPHVPAKTLFSEPECQVLADFARSRGVEGPANLGRAMKLLWMMGGYLDRKHDPPPGQRTVWDGYTYLQMGTAVLRRACAAGLDSAVGQYWFERAKAGA